MTPEERIRTRIDELIKRPLPDFFKEFAFVQNVVTITRQILGSQSSEVKILEDGLSKYPPGHNYFSSVVSQARGTLLGLKSDLEGGYLTNIRVQIRTEVEGDFLSQAHRLLEDKMKDPAAMLIGAVLEDSLRQLCQKHNIPNIQAADTINPMNVGLYKSGVYGLPQHEQVKAWAAIRNKADHANFGEYDISEVRNMHQGVAGFIAKYLS